MIGELISHYKILKKLGEGGMGVVYKAKDDRLDRTVALKFLPSQLTLDEEVRARFMQEAKAASALDHPNVCNVHEIDQTEEGQLFICMGYYEGETLKQKIERGPLDIEEAVDIAIQIAQGLVKAHAQGIIHRDIKPANILITQEGVIKIVDFGLAKLAGQAKLTATTSTIGTVAYMSPEQAGAEEVDHRTDIWSLGVVLYEMITGEVPFKGEHELAAIYSIMHEEPAPMSGLRPDVPPALAGIVTKALAKRPEDRFAAIDDMLTELLSVQKPVEPDRTTKRPAWADILNKRALHSYKVLLPIFAIAVLICAAALNFVLSSNEASLVRERVVIDRFENRTGNADLDAVGNMAVEWIAQGLQRTGIVEVVPSFTAFRASEHVREQAAEQNRDPMRALAQETGAGTVISGAYYLEGDTLRFHAEITDAINGKLLGALDPVKGAQDTPSELVESLREQLMGFLAASFDEAIGAAAAGAHKPPRFEAYRTFFEARRLQLQREFRAALPLYYRSFELDTTFVTPLFFAATTLESIRAYPQLDSLITAITALSDYFTECNHREVEYWQAFSAGDNERALAAIRLATELEPDNPRLLGTYAMESIAARHPREALDAIKRFDPEQGLFRGTFEYSRWTPYWSWMTSAYHMLGEHVQELDAARRAREFLPDDMATLRYELRALAALGQVEAIMPLLDESLTLAQDELNNSGRLMLLTALELWDHGHTDAARQVFSRATEWFRTQPPELAQTEMCRAWYGATLYASGQWLQAKQVFQKLRREFPQQVDYRGYLGLVAARLDDRKTVEKMQQWLANQDQPYLWGCNTMYLARIASVLGENDQAVALARQALAQTHDFTGRYLHNLYEIDFEPLRDYPPFQDLLRPNG